MLNISNNKSLLCNVLGTWLHKQYPVKAYFKGKNTENMEEGYYANTVLNYTGYLVQSMRVGILLCMNLHINNHIICPVLSCRVAVQCTFMYIWRTTNADDGLSLDSFTADANNLKGWFE